MSEEFLTVATFATVPEAEAARLMLESEGVPAILTDAEIVNMDWLLGTAVGYVKVQVPPSKAEAAAALLDRIEADRRQRRAAAADSEDDDWPPSDDLACLSCGTAMPDDEHRCPTCGWSYADGRE